MDEGAPGVRLAKFALTNLLDYVHDTENLSVIRAASKQLDDVARAVGTTVLPTGALVYAASSEALFKLDPSAEADLQAIADAVDDACRKAPYVTAVLKHVDPQPGWTLERSLACLDNQLRRAQMQQASVVPGDLTGKGPCGLDGVRPATIEGCWVGDGKRLLSGHAASRLQSGRRQRGWRARQLFPRDVPDDVDMEEEAGSSWEESFEAFKHFSPEGPIASKMCVLHADGNRFGACRRRLTRVGDLTAFSTLVEAALTRTLQEALRDLWAQADAHKALPFHVLYWAGDEFSIVVPAAAGVAVAKKILTSFSQGVRDALGEIGDGDEHKRIDEATGEGALTLALGMLVCDSHQPIEAATAASRRLCERAKTALAEEGSEHRAAEKAENLVSFSVVESGSVAGADREEGHDTVRHPLTASGFCTLVDELSVLRLAGFSSGRAIALSAALAAPQGTPEEERSVRAATWKILSRAAWGDMEEAIQRKANDPKENPTKMGVDVALRTLRGLRPSSEGDCERDSQYVAPWPARRELWDYAVITPAGSRRPRP